MSTRKKVGIEPSMYTFMWKLFKAIGDSEYIKIIYKSNNNSTDMLPYDITAREPGKIQHEVEKIIELEGTEINHGSINKKQWHLAILRSGRGKDERNLWIDYDSGYSHGHRDGMNIGLFAKGLDLMPDFGYIPVQFGGWHTPEAKWYGMTAAHNTVVIDGMSDNRDFGGNTTMWAIGDRMKVIRVSAPQLINGKQFERTIALIDITEKDSYILDIFRVVGRKDHAKFMHSHHGDIRTNGLILKPADEYGYETLMRNFQVDENPLAGWSADWKIEDYLNLVSGRSDLHLKYTDFTADAKAYICEGWISAGNTKEKIEKWIPRIMVRRQSEKEPLVSNFVGIIEPYEKESKIKNLRRLDLEYEDGTPAVKADAAIEVVISDTRSDLIVSIDDEDPLSLKNGKNTVIQKEWDLKYDGEFCMVSLNNRKVERVIICRGIALTLDGVEIRLKSKQDIIEIVFKDGKFEIVTGSSDNIDKIKTNV